MENEEDAKLVATIMIMVLALIVLIALRSIFKDVYNFLRVKAGTLNQQQKGILLKYQPYYNALSSDERRYFEYKVYQFLVHKHFVPRGMPQVSMEMKVLIAAAAVQITFKLPFAAFAHFRRILVYPDRYYSNINKRYHRGEVNARLGIIILSWKDFVEGYIQHRSGRNLGLHEMAHAVKLEGQGATGLDFMNPAAWKAWHHAAAKSMREDVEKGFFRNYAFTNRHEFFAVAVENFFERPRDFYRQKPELYQCLVNLLNQDPIKLLQNT